MKTMKKGSGYEVSERSGARSVMKSVNSLKTVRSTFSAKSLDQDLRGEHLRLKALWAPCFLDPEVERNFVAATISFELRKLLVRWWALLSIISILMNASSYSSFVVDGEITIFSMIAFGGVALQFLVIQLLLVLRFVKPIGMKLDTAILIVAFFLVLSLFWCDPQRLGCVVVGDCHYFMRGNACHSDEHRMLAMSLALSLVTHSLPLRAMRSLVFAACMPLMYLLLSSPPGFSPHPITTTIIFTLELCAMAAGLWASQRKKEVKERIDWLRTGRLRSEVELLARPTIERWGHIVELDSGVDGALDELYEAVHFENAADITDAGVQLGSFGWDQKSIDETMLSIRKKQSEDFGVSVAYLLSDAFQEMVERRTGQSDPTFYEIGNAFFFGPEAVGQSEICPRDGELGCALLDTLQPHHRGLCTHFLSWTWSYRLGMLRSALQSWVFSESLDPKREFLWMCFFVNNQYRILVGKSVNGSDNLETVFEGNVLRIKKVVALLDSWVNPVYLTRIWTIFEQFTSIKLGIEVTMILPPSAAENLLNEIEKGKEGILLVLDSFSKVDSENGKASMLEDELRVKRLIEQSVGFAAVDYGIKEFLIEWVAAEVQYYMKNLIERRNVGTGKRALMSCYCMPYSPADYRAQAQFHRESELESDGELEVIRMALDGAQVLDEPVLDEIGEAVLDEIGEAVLDVALWKGVAILEGRAGIAEEKNE